ncbi:hypothetical protein TNCV_1528801 [Trichonephila clavipes]|nr:hypothetical protein TNCV_1528801 [Trichonephila clavipes]
MIPDIGALIQSKNCSLFTYRLCFFGAVGGFVWQTKVLVEEYLRYPTVLHIAERYMYFSRFPEGGANKSGPEFLVTQKHSKRKEMIFVPLLITVAAKTFNHLFACLGPGQQAEEKISVLLDCPNASWEEFGAVDYDNLCTTLITADKDNLEFHQGSQNITEADLNDKNEMNNAPSSSEMKSIMKSVRSYLDSYSYCEMNNKMDDIEQLETI